MNIVRKTIISKEPGPKVVVLGGVHGDERTGVELVKLLMKELSITKGEVSLVIANPKAIAMKKRFVDKDLNRSIAQGVSSNTNEGKIAQELMPILERSDVLIDLHALIYKDNLCFTICDKGDMELARAAGFKFISTGWDKIHQRSTDGYMRSIGKVAICLELGSNDKWKENIEHGKRAVLRCLKYLKMVKGRHTSSKKKFIVVDVVKEIQAQTNSFYFSKKFKKFFNKTRPGQTVYSDGERGFNAKKGDCIICPEQPKKKGDFAFIFGKYLP